MYIHTYMRYTYIHTYIQRQRHRQSQRQRVTNERASKRESERVREKERESERERDREKERERDHIHRAINMNLELPEQVDWDSLWKPLSLEKMGTDNNLDTAMQSIRKGSSKRLQKIELHTLSREPCGKNIANTGCYCAGKIRPAHATRKKPTMESS